MTTERTLASRLGQAAGRDMTQDSDAYTVRLEAFEGPLDLLLHLIRRAEVDIVDIPIARIADQFLAHVEQAQRLDVEQASEFLVMAATLMEIKSRLLAPLARRPDAADDAWADDAETESQFREEWTDPRAGLVRQLLAYQWARDASAGLSDRLEHWSQRWSTAPVRVDRESIAQAIAAQRGERELEDLNPFDLAAAYERVVERVNFDLMGDHHILVDEDDAPMETHAERLVEALQRAPRDEARGARIASLGELLAGANRSEVIGMFLALLELLRRRIVGLAPLEAEAGAGADATLGALRLELLDESARGLEGGEPIEDPAPAGADAHD